jgi:hypothetical protein
VNALLIAVPRADAAPITIQIDMYGNQEAPPVQTRAWGFVRFFFNDERDAANYTVDVKGLPGVLVLGADIHRGAPGESGPIVKHLADGGFIVTAGRLRLTDDELAEMLEGMWYVSLKTVDHPEGELRGQIVLPTDFVSRPLLLTPPSEPEPVEESPPEVYEAPAEGLADASAGEDGVVEEAAAVSEELAAPPEEPLTQEEPEAGVVRPPNTGDGGLRRN